MPVCAEVVEFVEWLSAGVACPNTVSTYDKLTELSFITQRVIKWQCMSDERRRFAFRDDGEETSVFKGNAPRQAALKAARRLHPKDTEEEAVANSERIHLREHGTNDVHIYNAWAWEKPAPDDGPEWLDDTVTKANVSKSHIEDCSDSTNKPSRDRSDTAMFGEQIDVTQERCGRCGSSLDNLKVSVPVREVPDPKTVRYNRHHYECGSCQGDVVAEHQSCPSTGGFGVNLLAQVVLFHFEPSVFG